MDDRQWLGFRVGDRVELMRTTDTRTRLRPGDRGSVNGWDSRIGQLHVAWDDGSNLMMLIAPGALSRPGEPLDEVRLLPTEPTTAEPTAD